MKPSGNKQVFDRRGNYLLRRQRPTADQATSWHRGPFFASRLSNRSVSNVHQKLRVLRTLMIISPFFLALTAPLHAQLGREPIACFYDHRGGWENQNFKKKLWDGYEISLGPARNRNDGSGNGDDCTAAIYNVTGKEVFRTTGFRVEFDDELTGKDFDGDGKPEVVFHTDSGGGAHCCWAYNVVSLFPKPHKLFDIEAPGTVRFETDKQGKMTIWQRWPGPMGFTSMAERPFAVKVWHVRQSKLVDATPEFCSQILAPGNEDFDEERRVLAPEKLQQLALPETQRPDEDTASALLSRALQEVFCHRFDDALADLDLWPEATREKAKTSFAESVKDQYPEFAARLTGSAHLR